MNTDPQYAPSTSASSVYERDVRELLSSDLVVAHVGAPSTGVGAEIAIAAAAGLRIIALRRDSETVSRFAEGLILDAGGVLFSFDDDADLATKLASTLSQILP